MPDDPQDTLFDVNEFSPAWREWRGMPEYVHGDLTPYRQIIVSFASAEDVAEFGRLVGQRIGPHIRSLWFPVAEIGTYKDKRYIDED